MNRRVMPETQLPPAPIKAKSTAASSAERFRQPALGIKSWGKYHRNAAREAWQRLLLSKLGSLMTIILMGLALALPLLLVTLIANLNGLGKGLRASGEIAAFLRQNTPQKTVDALIKQLRDDKQIAAVTVRSPAQGIAELRSFPDFDQAIEALDNNPLPYVLLIRPDPEIDPAQLLSKLKKNPLVEQVQHDAEWQDRLELGMVLLQRTAWVTMMLFGIGVLLLVAHNVRVEVQSRANEIGIIKLLGASDGFVRRPFIWGGLWLGLISSLLAILIVISVIFFLQAPVQALAKSYDSDFILYMPAWSVCLTILASGVLLGSAGAFLAATVQLILDRAKY